MKRNILILCLLVFLLSIKSTAQDGIVTSLQRQAQSEINTGLKDFAKKPLGNALDSSGKAYSLYRSAKEIYDGLKTLKIGECLPEYSINPQALIPSSCNEVIDGFELLRNNPEELRKEDFRSKCSNCYEAAYKKLNDARRRLSKLKCLGLTTKTFVAKQASFGDTVSGGIGGLQGLSWQKARKGIMESYSKFKDAYDAKYKELMDALLDAMMEVDKCEAQNGQKDWFQRFGFIYVEFMAEKYKRVE